MAKRIVDMAFALGVSLRCIDYLTKEDLKSYGLAPIDEDDVSPLHATLGSIVVRPLVAQIESSRSSAEAMLPAANPSSSTFVPSWAPTKVAVVTSTPILPTGRSILMP